MAGDELYHTPHTVSPVINNGLLNIPLIFVDTNLGIEQMELSVLEFSLCHHLLKITFLLTITKICIILDKCYENNCVTVMKPENNSY